MAASVISLEGVRVPPSEIAFELSELESAAELVHQVIAPTPQYAWPKLRGRAGCTVWVKHENHTPTGAFKVRGGLVYLNRLRHADPKIPGVISATRGNHGQSIAFAAARAGVAATIYVPRGNSLDQNSAITAFGARVVEFGRDFDEAKHEAFRVAAAEGLHFVPSFHKDLVAGVASYALELFRSVSQLDAVYVGVGMGSGISGLIAVRDLLGLKTEIVGVGAARAPATALSFAAGRPVAAQSARTFADGLATREPDARAIATICRGAARVVEVSEDAIAEAMRIYFDDTHQVVEGAGAAPLAALLQERQRMANKNVAVVLSGGNIERARFLQVLGGDTPSVS
ncbi:MAG TPA: threonine dehydratase [Burkholderiaceae bacterium]|jgi:threonine dehydratase|nr:threonine dehydratase [Burkholderiaceae bacterium]